MEVPDGGANLGEPKKKERVFHSLVNRLVDKYQHRAEDNHNKSQNRGKDQRISTIIFIVISLVILERTIPCYKRNKCSISHNNQPEVFHMAEDEVPGSQADMRPQVVALVQVENLQEAQATENVIVIWLLK
ncbi:hypothetical protein ACLOJK_006628 [Asimina triloba]